MKKDSVVLWIMAMTLIATGVSLSGSSAQASDINRELGHCNIGRMGGDRVIGVRLSTVSGNDLWFVVDLAVDVAHLPGKEVAVAVLPFDQNGNNLASGWRSGHAALIDRPATSTHTTLKSALSLSQVVRLLVLVEGVSQKGVFKFCDVWNYADVAQPVAQPASPKVASTGPKSGYGYSYTPPVVSIESCSDIANKNPNSPGPPQCMGRGGGRNGFWGQAPWILIHFKPLAIGSHKLRVLLSGKNRQGGYTNLGSHDFTFTNREVSSYYWFRSPYKVGQDYVPLYFSFMLDPPHYGHVGVIELHGSYE